MGRGSWMTRERLGVAHIDHALKEPQRVETFRSRFESAFYTEGQKRAALITKIFLGHGIERIVGESRVVHPLHIRMNAEKFRNLFCIFDMALDTQGHGFHSLQKQESVERRESRAGIALADGAAARDVSGFAELLN